jgi:hypothetical protein
MRTTQLRVDQIRDAVVKTARMLARDGIKISQIGAQAFCQFEAKTGKVVRINLPVIPDEPSDEYLMAIQGFLDHEVAHALLTNGMTDCRQTLDGEGSAEVNLHGLTNIVEDVRIEAGYPKIFPGAEANLESLRDFMISRYWAKWLGQVNAAALPDAEKERRRRSLAFVPFMRARGGQKKCAEFLDENNLWPLFDELDRRIPDLTVRLHALTSTDDALKLAKLIHDAITRPPPKTELEPQPLGEDEAGTNEEEPSDQKGAGSKDDGKKQDLDDIDMGAPGDTSEPPPEPPPSKSDSDKGSEGEPDKGDADEGDEGEGDEPGSDGDSDEGDHADDDEPGQGDAASDGNKSGEASEDGKDMSLRQAMKRLKPEQRRALYLYNKKHKSVDEIASSLGQTVTQAGALLRSARRDLNNALGGKV